MNLTTVKNLTRLLVNEAQTLHYLAKHGVAARGLEPRIEGLHKRALQIQKALYPQPKRKKPA